MNIYKKGIIKYFFVFSILCLLTKKADSQVSSFTLVNASTDQDVQILNDGDILNLAAFPVNNFNIRANSNSVGSIVFVLSLNGTAIKTQTENFAPYSLFGDINGKYNSWVPQEGGYTLTATPFSAANGSGIAGICTDYKFSNSG